MTAANFTICLSYIEQPIVSNRFGGYLQENSTIMSNFPLDEATFNNTEFENCSNIVNAHLNLNQPSGCCRHVFPSNFAVTGLSFDGYCGSCSHTVR